MNTYASGMPYASRRIQMSYKDRLDRIHHLQERRMEIVSALSIMSAIELCLIVIYWGVMPVILIILNLASLLVNGILIMWLLTVYSDVKKSTKRM